MSTNLLAALMASAARAAHQREVTNGPAVHEAAARRVPNGAAFRTSLTGPGLNIIAECKRRSPSRGILRHPYDPATIAAGYASAGAAAISVITENTFFDGSLDDLAAVRARVDIPLLRKDFVSSSFQLTEARASGADAVLLIVAGLDAETLARLIREATQLGLATLVEVHSRAELLTAIGVGADLIGVNSRNLRTLDVDVRLLDEMVLGIPAGVIAVAESGLRSREDLTRLRNAGFDAFLIGERFMTAPDPGAALAEMLARPEGSRGVR
jgi:indole-3-glycerol phosphate synthase